MPVMKRLTVDGVNYDTVGEASVTQVQTSGTKIATVTIDGTATDLYAPEGDPVTMEDTAVDAAVDAAWPSYEIRVQNGNSTNYTIDKTYAVSGETVTVTITSMSGITGVSVSTGLSGGEPIASWNTVVAHTFTMPASDVYVDATIELAGGGSN